MPLSRSANRLVKGLLVSWLLVTGLSSCGFGGDRPTEIETAASQSVIDVPSDLENRETGVRITVPAGWIAVDGRRRGSADIYAAEPNQALYVLVMSESADTLNQFSLSDNAEQYHSLIQEELDSFEELERTAVSSIDNKPALQYELRGTVDGEPIVYLHTTIQGIDNYYQVVGWTTESSYRENEDVLRNVVGSFRGT